LFQSACSWLQDKYLFYTGRFIKIEPDKAQENKRDFNEASLLFPIRVGFGTFRFVADGCQRVIEPILLPLLYKSVS
jgi:hypothetical protein